MKVFLVQSFGIFYNKKYLNLQINFYDIYYYNSIIEMLKNIKNDFLIEIIEKDLRNYLLFCNLNLQVCYIIIIILF